MKWSKGKLCTRLVEPAVNGYPPICRPVYYNTINRLQQKQNCHVSRNHFLVMRVNIKIINQPVRPLSHGQTDWVRLSVI